MKYQIVKRILGISLAVCTAYGSVRGAYAAVMSGTYLTASNTESEGTYTETAAPESEDTYTAASAPESEKRIAASKQEEKEAVLPESAPEEQEEILPEPESEEAEISLEEYLSGLVCGACGRRCSLLNPRCRNGKHKAQSAEQQYYETYSFS